MSDALQQLRAVQAARGTHPTPKTPPTVIPWRLLYDLSTHESEYEYDAELVTAALAAPDEYIIAPVGKVLFSGSPEPAAPPAELRRDARSRVRSRSSAGVAVQHPWRAATAAHRCSSWSQLRRSFLGACGLHHAFLVFTS